MKTKVQSCENNSIDRFGLSLSTIGDICDHGPGHDFLVDVVGLMTGISAPREYIYRGKITRMIVFEMTDNSGKCECILSGHYVDDLEKILGNRDDGLPVVIVQFAKIRNFREAISFKKGLALRGVETSSSIPAIGPRGRPSFEEDFLVNYPITSIANLLERVEDGIYVVGATVDGLVEAEEWWYPGCSCHRIVSADSGAFYCKECVKRPFQMVARFRVKVRVDDGSGQAIFIVFDNDMNMLLGKHCHELVALSK
ncbi:replication factor A protein, partial [Trifolium medium]|nr:replication factor A protein [Trifolium medium]